ncbi:MULTISPECIES: 2-keto-3-deoxygluconate permease [Helcococcus]|uniref:2-keto-3-deoxygluconate permease n=1 Tax=Helcococcus bovis TaxID=3153252 RepID=A0ABW9F6S8_9FIRM
MKLKKIKIPGDTIIIPMFIGLMINTFIPSVLQIGGFTTAIAKGTGPLVGAFLFFIGGTISLKNTPKAIGRGATIIITKIAFSVAFGLFVTKVFNNNFLGLSALSIIGAISVANNAMYSGIVDVYGNEIDAGAVGITTLSVGPMVTMAALSSAGLANISILSLVGTVFPLILGIALSNIFPYMKKVLSNGVTAIIIIVGFALGCNISLLQLVQGGLPGILLGVITSVVGAILCVSTDRLTGGSGVAGAAISSTAASAIATPAALSAVDATFKAIEGTATTQIAASVIVTAILTPILTGIAFKMAEKRGVNPKVVA